MARAFFIASRRLCPFPLCSSSSSSLPTRPRLSLSLLLATRPSPAQPCHLQALHQTHHRDALAGPHTSSNSAPPCAITAPRFLVTSSRVLGAGQRAASAADLHESRLARPGCPPQTLHPTVVRSTLTTLSFHSFSCSSTLPNLPPASPRLRAPVFPSPLPLHASPPPSPPHQTSTPLRPPPTSASRRTLVGLVAVPVHVQTGACTRTRARRVAVRVPPLPPA